MKIHASLEELLEAFGKTLFPKQINLPEGVILRDAKRFLSSNSLALGKPEPLAKNKQTQLSCDECGSNNTTSYNDGFRERCNDCGARIGTRKADATSR